MLNTKNLLLVSAFIFATAFAFAKDGEGQPPPSHSPAFTAAETVPEVEAVVITNAPLPECVVEPGQAVEEKSPFTFNAQIDFYSAYVWRGIVFCEEPVYEPGAQIHYDAGVLGRFMAGVWANAEMGDNRRGHDGGVTEADYFAGWNRNFGQLVTGLGYAYCQFPQRQPANLCNIHVVSASIDWKNSWVTPFVNGNLDINESDGFYAQFGLSRAFVLTEDERLFLRMSTYLSWGSGPYNRYYFGQNSGDLVDYNVTLSLAYALTKNVTIGGTVAASGLIDGTIRDQAQQNYGYNDLVWGGFNIALRF